MSTFSPYFLFYYFLLHLLGCHWLIKLYSIWVYNSIIHRLYIVLCVHPFIEPYFLLK